MNDNQRYFVEEFAEDYQLGRMNRRELLRRVLLITGGAASAASALVALGWRRQCGFSRSLELALNECPSVRNLGGRRLDPSRQPGSGDDAAGSADRTLAKVDDPSIKAQNVQFSGQAGTVFGYLAQPKSGGAVPGIIIVPENRGLVEPNMDIARRYAKEGFAALAVDLVSREGGTAKYTNDPAQIPAILGRTAQPDLVADLVSAVAYLKTADGVRKDRFGVTGFCFGGSQAFALAIASPDIRAAVPFYGTVKPEDVVKSQAAFLNFYGELDTRVTSTADPAAQAV